jgi:hypothetical protein
MSSLANAIALEAAYQHWVAGLRLRDVYGRRAYFATLGWVKAAHATGGDAWSRVAANWSRMAAA